MSDNISNQDQGGWMGLIDWDDWEACDWAGVWDPIPDDAAQTRATRPNSHQPIDTTIDSAVDTWMDSEGLSVRDRPTNPGNETHYFSNIAPAGSLQPEQKEVPCPTIRSLSLYYNHTIPSLSKQNVQSDVANHGFPFPQAGSWPYPERPMTIHGFGTGDDTNCVDVMNDASTTISFTSGNNAKHVEGARTPSVQKSRKDLQLSCPQGDCKYQGTFPRQYELDRHLRVKHCGQKPFSCPFPGCVKGKHAPAFARPDNMTSHIRTRHGKDTRTVLSCPAKDCTEPQMPANLLGMHIKKRHLDMQGSSTGNSKAYVA